MSSEQILIAKLLKTTPQLAVTTTTFSPHIKHNLELMECQNQYQRTPFSLYFKYLVY